LTFLTSISRLAYLIPVYVFSKKGEDISTPSIVSDVSNGPINGGLSNLKRFSVEFNGICSLDMSKLWEEDKT